MKLPQILIFDLYMYTQLLQTTPPPPPPPNPEPKPPFVPAAPPEPCCHYCHRPKPNFRFFWPPDVEMVVPDPESLIPGTP